MRLTNSESSEKRCLELAGGGAEGGSFDPSANHGSRDLPAFGRELVFGMWFEALCQLASVVEDEVSDLGAAGVGRT